MLRFLRSLFHLSLLSVFCCTKCHATSDGRSFCLHTHTHTFFFFFYVHFSHFMLYVEVSLLFSSLRKGKYFFWGSKHFHIYARTQSFLFQLQILRQMLFKLSLVASFFRFMCRNLKFLIYFFVEYLKNSQSAPFFH